MLRLGVIVVCATACGAPDSNALTRTSSTPGSTGGMPFAVTGGAYPFGAGGIIVGSGGSTPSGGTQSAGFPGVGGFIGAGGLSVGSGGLPDSGVPSGAGGADSGSGGTVTGTGGTPVDPFPPGGLITQACSDCARTNCREQEAACVAEPACAAIGQCLSTCIFLTCAACLPTLSGQAGYTKFTAVSNCTDLHCQPACPFINGGGGVNP